GVLLVGSRLIGRARERPAHQVFVTPPARMSWLRHELRRGVVAGELARHLGLDAETAARIAAVLVRAAGRLATDGAVVHFLGITAARDAPERHQQQTQNALPPHPTQDAWSAARPSSAACRAVTGSTTPRRRGVPRRRGDSGSPHPSTSPSSRERGGTARTPGGSSRRPRR